MKYWILFLWLCSLGCLGEATSDGEDYGNLLDSPEGLVLTEEEHPGGWGRAECTQCHNLDNIHRVDRTGIGVDIDAIHDQALAEGTSGCAACHGTNGVP